MNYILFRNKNSINKNFSNNMARLESADIVNNKCILVYNNKKYIMTIADLVNKVMYSNFCVSNPSMLYKYNFNRTIKHKEFLRNKRKELENMNKVSDTIRNDLINKSDLIFHGSENGLKGEISLNSNKGVCDFGAGFYTSYSLEQAENRVANKKDSVLYSYYYDFNSLDVYNFTDIVLWALYVGYNRQILNINSTRLLKEFKNISNHDIIIGHIADDKISKVYNDFLGGNITDICLAECLKLVKYGKQVLIKTEKAKKSLTLYKCYKLTNQMKKDSINWGMNLKKNMDNNIADYKIKFRTQGKYIDQVLKEYK